MHAPCTETQPMHKNHEEGGERQTCPLARSISKPTHAVKTPTPLRQENRRIASKVDGEKGVGRKQNSSFFLWLYRRGSKVEFKPTFETLQERKIGEEQKEKLGKENGGQGGETKDERQPLTRRLFFFSLQWSWLVRKNAPHTDFSLKQPMNKKFKGK